MLADAYIPNTAGSLAEASFTALRGCWRFAESCSQMGFEEASVDHRGGSSRNGRDPNAPYRFPRWSARSRSTFIRILLNRDEVVGILASGPYRIDDRRPDFGRFLSDAIRNE